MADAGVDQCRQAFSDDGLRNRGLSDVVGSSTAAPLGSGSGVTGVKDILGDERRVMLAHHGKVEWRIECETKPKRQRGGRQDRQNQNRTKFQR